MKAKMEIFAGQTVMFLLENYLRLSILTDLCPFPAVLPKRGNETNSIYCLGY